MKIELQHTVVVCAVGCFIAITAITPLRAQTIEKPDRNTSATTELLLDGDDIVTTATRNAQRVSDSPEAVTVITEEQIAASGATTIPELLRSVPGVDVMEPNLSQQNVSIRGFNERYGNTVLVMVDGRRINEDFNSSVFWTTNPILLSRIKRIEIVRGPSSVLYGADAFDGVIDIILKKPSELAAESKTGTFIGSYEDHASEFAETNLTVLSKNGWAVTLGLGYHDVIGPYSGQSNRIQDSSSVPICTLDVEKPLSRGSILFSVDNSDAKADQSSGYFLKDASVQTDSVALAYTEDRGANPVTARVYENSGRIGASTSHADQFDIQQLRPIGLLNDVTYGASYRNVSAISSPTGPDEHSDHVASLFIQDEDRIGSRTTLFAGARDDQNSVYGGQVSTRFSLVHHLEQNRSLRISYGSAFSAPTFDQNFIDYNEPIAPGLNLSIMPNTNLKPEQITSSEIGYRADFASGYAGLNVFYNQISDVIEGAYIQYAPPPFPAGTPDEVQFQNHGTASSAGFEVDGGFPIFHSWNALANYSFQHVENGDGSRVDFSPDDKINLVLQSDQKRRFTTYFAGHYVSSTTSQNQYIRAYTTVDGRIGYRLGRSQNAWTASIAAVNLLDDHHREYVDQPGESQALSISEPAQRQLQIMLSGKF